MKTRAVIAFLAIPTLSGILGAANPNRDDSTPTKGNQGGAENRGRTETRHTTDEPADSGAPLEASPIPGTGGSPEDREPPPEYESWETANGIGGAGAAADSDGDGIPNGIEFVIGGDPSGPDSDSNSLLPTVTIDEEFMYFIYRRADVAAGYNPFVEYSGTLAEWTPADPGVDGVFIEEAGDFFEPGVARVIVRIPRNLGSGSALFTRLRVDITP